MGYNDPPELIQIIESSIFSNFAVEATYSESIQVTSAPSISSLNVEASYFEIVQVANLPQSFLFVSEGYTVNFNEGGGIAGNAFLMEQIQIVDLNFYNSSRVKGNSMHFANVLSLELDKPVYTKIQIVPLIVGQYIDFSFPISGDTWSDENGWLYFKPSGKTIGSLKSKADYARDDLELLFKRLYDNQFLLLVNDSGEAIAKTNVDSDWKSGKALKLPYHPGAVLRSPGRANLNETTWAVGQVAGKENYELKLKKHKHDINQISHSHNIEINPHSHNGTTEPHAHELPLYGETGSSNLGGRDFDNTGNNVLSTSLSASSEVTITPSVVQAAISDANANIEVAYEGDDVNRQSIITPSVCVEVMIFAGVRSI